MGKYYPDLPQRIKNQMGKVELNPVQYVAEEVYHFYPVEFLWGRSNGTSGEHPKGLALDFSVLAWGNGVNDPGPARPALGNAIANYLWANRKRLGVWYVIWNRRIISTNPDSYAYNRWVTYRGEKPHTDHVHSSHYAADVYKPPISTNPPKEEDMDLTAQNLTDIGRAVWAHKHQPGPFAKRIGGYESDAYPAGGIAVGPDAYGRWMYNNLPKLVAALSAQVDAQGKAILAILENLGEQVTDEVRTALENGVVNVEVEVRNAIGSGGLADSEAAGEILDQEPGTVQ